MTAADPPNLMVESGFGTGVEQSGLGTRVEQSGLGTSIKESRELASESTSGSLIGGATSTAGVCGPCGFVNEAGSKFCEDCGKPLDQSGAIIAAQACSACESTTFDADGYCQECGTKAPSPRDHAVLNFGILASVTDRGITHPINQDAVDCVLFVGSEAVSGSDGIDTPQHLARVRTPQHLSRVRTPDDVTELASSQEYDRRITRAVLVVCDGVSTSSASDVASAAAVSVTKTRLQQCVSTEPESAVSALIEAAKLAQTAVSSTPFRKTVGLDAPSCTFVAATVAGGRITVGNIGDSRAYVFGDDGIDRHLSADDSWAAEEIRTGRRTPENAESDPRAHMITRWLGSDAPNVVPSIVEHEPASGAILLLCSDGLWNYASSLPHLRRILDDAIEDLLAELPVFEVSMEQVAEALCSFALSSGGQDNIAIALLRMGPPITAWVRNSERVPKVDPARGDDAGDTFATQTNGEGGTPAQPDQTTQPEQQTAIDEATAAPVPQGDMP
jgi:serine/threonine protein phosphatase PrpC